MVIVTLIRQLEEDPDAALQRPEVFTPQVFDLWICRCLELTSSNPLEGLAHVDTALRIAVTPCQIVQCYGVTSAAHRALGQLDRAFHLLAEAFRISRGCRSCRADLLRRRAHVYTSMGSAQEALSDADAAVNAYGNLADWPDHDLNRNGLASAHLSRGDIRQFFGIPAKAEVLISGAVEDFSKALALSNPQDHPRIYRAALFNMSAPLKASGTLEDLKRADEYIREAQAYFQGRSHVANRDQAYLDWQTGMIRLEIRRHPGGKALVRQKPHRLRKMLRRALEDFLEIGMAAEGSAVAADLARLTYPRRAEIAEFVSEFLGVVRLRWPSFSEETRTAFAPIEPAFQAVRRAAQRDVVGVSAASVDAEIRASIERLRRVCEEAVQGKLLTCLLTWPQSF